MSPATDPKPAPRKPRRRPWFGLMVAGLALLFVLALATSLTLSARSEAGTRWLLDHVPGLSASGVRGTLWGDTLTIETLRWQGTAQQPVLEARGFELVRPRWRLLPHVGAWLQLASPSLKVARLVWHSPRESAPASAPPAQLRLPFTLDIEALHIAQLQIDEQAPWLDLRAQLLLGDADGVQHRIASLTLHNDRVQIRGDGRIGSDAPMPLALQLQANPIGAAAGPAGAAASAPWQASVQVDGPLASFALRATLRSDTSKPNAPSLDAQARIEPFAAWPLAALQLSTRALDLSVLSSAAPRTRLDAQAQVQTAGLDRPAQASVRIVNHEPGRIDNGRVPLRELKLELAGTPNQLDRIDITQFDAALADEQAAAGRVQGRGQWVGAELRLQAQLSGVEPARLHRHAGAMRAGGALTLALNGVPLPGPGANAARSTAPWSARIDGSLDGKLLRGTGQAVRAELGLTLAADAFELTRFSATSGEAAAQATLKAQRTRQGNESVWHVVSKGDLQRFDPLPWWPGNSGSAWALGPHRINGGWQLDAQLPQSLAEQLGQRAGAAVAAVRGQAQLELNDSTVAGAPLAAQLSVRGDGHALVWQSRANSNQNQATLDGQWSAEAAQDRWQLKATLPALAALRPLAALAGALPATSWPTAGAAQLQADVQGRWPSIGGSGSLHTTGMRIGDAALQDGRATWRFTPGDDPTLDLTLTLKALSQGEQRLDDLQARVDGTLREHRLSVRADSPVRPPSWADNLLGSTASGSRMALEGRGAWRAAADGGGTWQASELSFNLGARAGNAPATWLAATNLQGSVQLDGRNNIAQAMLAPGRATLPGGAALRWTQAAWRAEGRRFDLSSELEPLAVAPLLARLQPELGWGGDLKLAGRIEVHAAERFDADIVLARSGGDLRIADETGTPQPLGIGELQLAFSAHEGVWRFAQGAAGRQFGEMVGAQTARTNAQARWPGADAPLEGVLQMRVANLAAWGVWVPPGWRLGGNLQVNAALGGRFAAPEFRGEVRGNDLSARNLLQGINVTDGELLASLDGLSARVQRLAFKGGDGQLQLSGEATLGETPSARLRVVAERFRLLARIDRRIVTSGSADLQLARDVLKLDGRFTVDEGLIDFSRGSAAGLDADVIVVRAASAPSAVPAAAPGIVAAASAPGSVAARDARAPAPLPATLRNAQVNLALGLGEKLQVRGRGLDATLRGDLRLSTPGGRLAINGAVRASPGTYIAYAQKMVIERGELVFTGTPENPRLDIIAVRPNLDIRVGVAVVGPLSNPRVRLFSEPEMSEMDKLSWLVLGRASEGLGRNDTALLQRAALALLAGEEQAPTDQLLNQLGITDFSLRQSEGEVRETIVSLGRQLSQRWYVGYERSVNATTGTWQLVYRIAQRFTLRAQSGQENAVDLIWSWRW